MSKELEFLEEKYGHNSWKHYPPSKEQVAQWLQEWNEKQFAICGVRRSNWIKYEETKFVEDGIYQIKTSEGRTINAERFKGFWMEYDTPIKEK